MTTEYVATSSEDLQEALVAAERLRVQERRTQREAQALLKGLQALTRAEDVDEMFAGVLEVIKELVPYALAAILIEHEDGSLNEVASTRSDSLLASLPVSGVVERALSGKAAALADLSVVAEMSVVLDALDADGGSAMLLPLEVKQTRAILLCCDEERSTYSRRHLRLLAHVTPLVAQALQRSSDMAELDRVIHRLDHLAHHDALTGLPNRNAFADHLRLALNAARRVDRKVAVLRVGVDDFKIVNDTMGHQAGDELLEHLSVLFRSVLRPQDTVARVGGDEFTVVIPGLLRSDVAVSSAHRLLDKALEPMRLRGLTWSPQVSVGVSVFPDDETDAEQLISGADAAMHRAKQFGGRQVVVFTKDMRAELELRSFVERQLRNAIATDELRVQYQPLFHDSMSAPKALEALVRWQHPERGMLSPAQFLPIAEQSGLIIDLGWWVTNRALADGGRWLREDPTRRVALNVAGRQLMTPGFADELAARVRSYRLPTGAIELELSEEVAARRNASTIGDVLGDLADRGFLLSFDDFGTGYTSIKNLRAFPGQTLKIDRSFIAAMDENASDAAIVRAILDLGHGMGMRVVAEGVETDRQLKMLQNMGCDEFQGFLLGRPGAIEQFITHKSLAA